LGLRDEEKVVGVGGVREGPLWLREGLFIEGSEAKVYCPFGAAMALATAP